MQDDPLRSIKRGFNITIVAAFFFFLATTVYFLVFGAPSHLSRLGAAWIAFVVFFFGFAQMIVLHVKNAAHGKGPFAAEFEKKVGPFIFSEGKGWGNFVSKDGRKYEQPLRTREEVQRLVDDLESSITIELYFWELTIIAMATLLTGFGDLLFCAVRLNGGIECSS